MDTREQLNTGRVPSLGIGGINIRPLTDTAAGMYTSNTLPEIQYERGKAPTMPNIGTAPTKPTQYGVVPYGYSPLGWADAAGEAAFRSEMGRYPQNMAEYYPWKNAKNAASTNWYNTEMGKYNEAKTSASNWYTDALAKWNKSNSTNFGNSPPPSSPMQRRGMGGQGMSGINV